MQAHTGNAASTGTSKGVSTFTLGFRSCNLVILSLQSPTENSIALIFQPSSARTICQLSLPRPGGKGKHAWKVPRQESTHLMCRPNGGTVKCVDPCLICGESVCARGGFPMMSPRRRLDRCGTHVCNKAAAGRDRLWFLLSTTCYAAFDDRPRAEMKLAPARAAKSYPMEVP
jgi:hypothetical protein